MKKNSNIERKIDKHIYIIICVLLMLNSCRKDKLGVWLTEGQEQRAIGTSCYLLKIAHDGLNKYKERNGRNLFFEGKYFIDSIKIYLPDNVLNVCCDDWGYNNSIINNEKFLSSINCYLCVTVGDSPIIYRYNGDMDYPILYWVGLNFIDEYGKGDDIVYDQAKECNP